MTPFNPDPNHRNTGSIADDAGNGTTKQTLKEDARNVKREVGAIARETVETGQHRLADGADALSEAIDAAASNLDDHDREGLARYARELSTNLAKAAGQLEGRSIDQLANDAKRLARDNPALFMLGSIAVGFGLSRFFKASAERDHDDNDAHQTYTQPNDDTFRAANLTTGTPLQRPGRETNPRNGDGRETL